MTGAFALLLVPAAIVVIWLVLPAYWPSLPPLIVLLPGVVVLSVTYVLSGYFRGIGRPGITSTISVSSMAVNVVINLILIPHFGIIGASAASLVSYSLTSFALTVVAGRVAGVRAIDFWLPRVSDIRYLVAATAGILGPVTERWRAAPEDPGA